MDITLEMVDQVRERTGASYEAVREALTRTNGNVVDAIVELEKQDDSCTASDIVEKIKAAVQKGNVNRIRVLRGEEELVNIPVNAGIGAGVLGLMAGPWVLISAAVAGAVAKYSFDCRFQLIREDGTIDEIGKGCCNKTCDESAKKDETKTDL